MSSSDDTFGCLAGGAALLFGGWWWFNHYEIKKKVEAPPAVITPVAKPVEPLVTRPTGVMNLSFLDGDTWKLDADSVSGPRTARMAWITIEHGKKPDRLAAQTRELWQIDCNTTAVKTLSSVDYDAKRKPITSIDTDPEKAQTTYYPPGTIGSTVLKTACRSDFDENTQK